MPIKPVLYMAVTLTPFKNYLEVERRLSKYSVDSYLYSMKSYFGFSSELTSESITDYNQYMHSKGFSRSTVSLKLSVIKVYIQFLKSINASFIAPLFKVSLPKVARSLPKTLTESEVVLLAGGVTNSRDRLIMELLYNCGLRESEVIDIQVANIDLVSGIVRVLGKGNKERMVPFTESVSLAIKGYLLDSDRKFLSEIARESDMIGP